MTLWAWTTRAPVRRTASPTSSGPEPAAQQPRGGAALESVDGVALEHLDVLAEVLADQPRQVLDRALLAAGDAVAVVEEQDHGGGRCGGTRGNLTDRPA